MDELCTWEYQRQSYLVIYKDNDDVKYYYSPGENIDLAASEASRDEILDGQDFSILKNGPIDDRDSVKSLLQRLALEFDIKQQYFYMYYSHKTGDSPIIYDFTYKASSKVVQKLEFTANPEDDFQLSTVSVWDKVIEHDFTSSILDSLKWGDGLRVIHCYPITYHLYDETGKGKSQDDITDPKNINKLKLYYPRASSIMTELFDIATDKSKVRLTNDKSKHEEITSIVGSSTAAINIINNLEYNREVQELNDKNGDNPVTFGAHCNILEVVIHVNYNENNMEFVDLKKLFYMLTTTQDMPYARYFYDGEKAPKYKVHKDLVNRNSDIYLPKEVLQDWINPKLNKVTDRGDVHEVHKELIKKIGNRGLSLKFVRPGAGERKYFTLNIYRNGRMDIKCHWDENYGDPDTPAGNAELISKAIEKVIKFTTEINKLQYHFPSQGKKKISVPHLLRDAHNNNTNVAFYNTITTFDFGDVIDRDDFMDYLARFTNSHIVLVERKKISGTDTRSFEFRYKRINNYLHITNVHRSIKQYIETNKENTPPSVLRKSIIDHIRRQYTLTEDEGRIAYSSYEHLYSLSGDTSRKRGRKAVISEYQISNLLDRSVERKTAIDIKILKRNPKMPNDYKYKCLILGIDSKMLGRIIHFIKQSIMYYKYRAQLTFFKDMPTKGSDVDQEDPTGVDLKQLKPPVKKPKKVQGFLADSSDEEYSSDESDSELEDSPTSSPVPSTSPVAAASVPSPVVPKRSQIARSMLDILQERLPKIYKTKVKYSSKCQRNTSRQPLVVSPQVKDKIKAFIERKKQEIEGKLQNPDSLTEMDILDLKLHLKELDIHSKTVEHGADYNDNFFFCPLTWDWDDYYYGDNADHNITLPRLADAEREGIDGRFYNPRLDKWTSGADKIWKANYGKKTHDRALNTTGDPQHPWYLSFITDVGDPKKDTCMACCFKGRQDKSIKRKEECLSGGRKKVGTTNTSQGYILSDKHRSLGNGRFARISKKLDIIFNSNDPNDEGYKVASSGTIAPGFDFFLRKGVASGNKFINAIGEINPKVKVIDLIIKILENGINQTGSPEALEMFKSLKSGTIYHLFTPVDIDQDIIDQADSDESLRNAIGMISLVRFRDYVKEKSSTINEDFLWDILSLPGVILPQGLNIIVCETKTTGSRSREVETGSIKCPVGFEISSIYDVKRPSIVLYKYENTYEVVCKVKATEARGTTIELLFESNHPLVDEIVSYIKTQCIPKGNVHADNELEKHVNNVSVGNYNSKGYVDNLFHLPKVNKETDCIKVHPFKPINLNQAVQNINAAVIDDFKILKQVVDSYNKVTHLIIDNDDPTISRWIPIQPSGISLHNEEVEVISRQKSEEELPELLTFIRDMIFLKEYVNFAGYTPYGFLLDPGKDLDDPEDDIIIGVVLDNGLITFTIPIAVRKFNALDESLVNINVKHPTLDLEPVNFDARKLLYRNMHDQWFSDYKDAEALLEKQNTYSIDKRKAYTVRSLFEQETYQRLRYELSKELATPEYTDVVEQIKGVLGMNDDLQGKRINVSDTRVLIKDLINPIIQEITTGDAQGNLPELVGPLGKGYDDLTEDEITEGQYKYVRPYIRYECSNLENADKRIGDPHCNTTDPTNHKVFVSDINLVTGKADNLTYYTDMIVEELLRMPLKRYQILDDEIDNLIIDYYVENDTEFYIDAENEAELYDNVYNIYDTTVNYEEKMRNHYDIVNPRNSKILNRGECNKIYTDLPSYWIDLLKTMQYKIQRFDGPNNCFYEELNNIISKINSSRGNTGQVNTRYSILEMVKNDSLFQDSSSRPGWERYRDLYSVLFPQVYKHVQTKNQLLDIIKNSERHKITHIDLSIISRKYNIIFIILNQPRPRTDNKGIACLGTTQVDKSKPVAYILLYLQGLIDFSIIADHGESPPKDFFVDDDFAQSPKVNLIHSKWVESCLEQDGKDVQDPASMIFQGAPKPVKTSTGHIRFTDSSGNLLTSISQKKRAKLKKTSVSPSSPPIGTELLNQLVQPQPKAKIKPKFKKTSSTPPAKTSPPQPVKKKLKAVLLKSKPTAAATSSTTTAPSPPTVPSPPTPTAHSKPSTASSTPMCPPGKIYNPRTGKCVSRTGAVGRKLVAAAKKK